ncbi:hypothetical protein NA57DRAFT_56682 [Rhizodiscina lignyota]|uniref:Uncharacterized protein n=1 Tax=Rhizodiscina lignyota TaxID=1504668 RepID=A0A9P4IG84_9PEZI|nr:hypothetical protein NA57DRAFT_56682 [Rhizodiscina lignyota]
MAEESSIVHSYSEYLLPPHGEIGSASRDEGDNARYKFKWSAPTHKAPSCWILFDVMVILLVACGMWDVSSRAFAFLAEEKLTYAVSYNGAFEAKYEKQQPCYCGATSAEAMKNGCEFDELSFSWLPALCRDEELTAEFARVGEGGQWQYWADVNRSEPLSLDLVRHDPKAVYMSPEWHVQQCFFLWLKEHRMKTREGKFYDPAFDTDEYILYCMDLIGDGTKVPIIASGD